MASSDPPDVVALDGHWILERVDEPGGAPLTARVPGCVHTDLLVAGLIPDPFLDRNELDVAWVADADWRYRTTIAAGAVPAGRDRVDLVFGGLDTLAEVMLDGIEVARTENMHRTYRIDATDVLTAPGDHELVVTFRSATKEAEARRAREGDWPTANFGRPFNYVRKMACSWGWDWGPWLTTAGIWRPAAIEAWDIARLASVRPVVTVGDDDRGEVTIAGRIERAGDAAPALAVTVELSDQAGRSVATATADVAAGATGFGVQLDAGTVERWWPAGHGSQPLYTLRVHLGRSEGDTSLGCWTRRLGFRSVELDTASDATGSAFTFVINGRPIFARGVNWIPDDPFPSRVTPERYRERLGDAIDANVTMIRVWGGGIYEGEAFYDACDERGLLVWQDFAFACAAYPEHLIAAEVDAEAREHVERLMPHPSLVLWNGNNENIWGHTDWDWQRQLDGRSWGAGFYFDLLPRIVAEIDPARPYWPGSPYSGSRSVAPNADAHGCIHEWEVWNRLDHSRYRDRTPRFVSEFGWQAPPAWATLRAAVSDEPLTPTSTGVLHHQKAADGNAKLERGLAHHFDTPGDVDAWLWACQLNQARAVRTGVEHFRSLRGHCMGTIWWQLNDCWPVTSWAVVDAAGRRKPAWFALRDSYAPRLATIQPRGSDLVLFAVNDTGEPWRFDGSAGRWAFDGTAGAEEAVTLTVAPWSIGSWTVPAPLATPADAASEVLRISAADATAWWWWATDRELRYPAPVVTVEWQRDGDPGPRRVDVTAVSLVRDLAVAVDRAETPSTTSRTSVIDRQLVTLLPGERTSFVVTSSDAGALDRLASAPAASPLWWSANDLAARHA